MSVLLRMSLTAVILALGCSQTPSGPSASGVDDATVVAVLNGDEITLAELDDWIKDDLLREQLEGKPDAAAHEFREERLRAMLDERLLAEAAAAEGVEPSALLARQAGAAVSDEEVAEFYEQNKERLGDSTLEQMSGRIRSHLQGREKAKARQAYVAGLRQSAELEVLFEAPRVSVAADGPSIGPDDAPITIVEFSDFQCPFCARTGPIVKQLLARYPEQVRVVYRHFPLESIHPRARAAAEASLCAADQGLFWKYHDIVFDNARKLSDEDLATYATQANLDLAAFQQCFDEGHHKEKVSRDLAEGRQVGVTGTPTFFINGRQLGGAQPLEEFVRVIDAELASQGASG